ncbi:MAG TPA: family 1 glycosylhydrolase [Acidimicrobiales bacterium]|nr:family 1 glycosylhydrolase [Acidimicrobiales bacterium]
MSDTGGPDTDPGEDADAAPAPAWWGTGAAATQCEGAAPRSDWAGWEADGFVPPSADGNGFRTRFADDLALVAEHGLLTFRLTVEWARLEPSPGQWDTDAADHLVRVLSAAEEAGVAVWACLLHGSGPGWFTDDQRGWRAGREAVLAWARHVDRVAEAIGDRVAGWVPIHEPDTLARLGYGEGTFPPGRRDEDDHRTARATLRAAEAEAARLLRSGKQPVAVSAPFGPDAAGPDAADRDPDDLLVVSAPVGTLARELERTAGAAPDAELLVVTGDPAPGSADERATRMRTGVRAVTEAASTVAVRGAFVLPALDGYEWHRGFTAALGLFDRDRNPRPALDAIPRQPRDR